MKLSSTKLKVFGGWIVVLMCIMAFSSKVLGSESIPKERENYQFTERSVPLKSGKAQVRKYRKRSSRNPVGIINISKLPARTRVAKINAQNSPANLFGFLAATNSYEERDYGIYSINPNTGDYSKLYDVEEYGEGEGGGTYANGKFYLSVFDEFYWSGINSAKLVVVDVVTGDKQVIEKEAEYPNAAVNMTYDPVNDVVYSINYDEAGEAYTLSKLDLQTLDFTVVAPMENSYRGMCIDGEGQMYVIDDYGDVYKFDKESAVQGEKVVSTGFSPEYSQSCCWSPLDRKIYWAACNWSESELIVIDPVSKEFYTQLAFENGEEWIGLYTTDPFSDPSAPAAVENLSISYATPGATTARISCDLPTRTAGGNELKGLINVAIVVDGDTVQIKENQSPGAEFSISLVLTNGLHVLKVICLNSGGEGVTASIKTFTGEDMPQIPTEVTAVAEESGKVTLSWTLPEAGINGGWVNLTKVSYDILRNGESLSTDIKETTYIDNLPENELKSYKYTVIVKFGGEECGSVESNSVVFGKAVSLPYEQTFEDASSFDLLNIIDNNGDGVTWQFDTGQFSAGYTFSADNAADDYLVLPKMTFKAYNVYQLSFDICSGSGYNAEIIGVKVGAEPSVESLSTIVMEPTEIMADASSPRHIVLTYVPEANGQGNFAIHCTSVADRFGVNVDNIRVEEFGSIYAPKGVTDFVVTADQTGLQKATMSFVVPKENYQGEPLSSVSKIEILRNGKLIKTFENPVLGVTLTYEDEHSDFGFNTYGIVAYSGENAGVKVEQTVFCGIYSLPYIVAPTQQEFSLFTIKDNNNDDNTWYYDISDGSLKYAYCSNSADDYVITPAIELGTAHMIEVVFDAKAGVMGSEKLEVTYGKSDKPEDQQKAQTFDLTNKEYQTFTATFEVTEHGRYYVGFHAISDPDQFTLNIKNIEVRNGALMKAPAAVTELKATPAAQGGLSATLSFRLPTQSLNGEELTGTVDVTVKRVDGFVVAEFTGKQPGEVLSCNDENAVQGNNVYTVVAKNEFSEGGTATVKCYCGIDVPSIVPNFTALPSSDNLKAELSWSVSTVGVHNGYFQPSDITYKIYEYVGTSYREVGTTTALSYTATPSSSKLDSYTFLVSATTIGGEGEAALDNVVLGIPYTMPFEENGVNNMTTTYPWIMGALSGQAEWGLTNYIRSLGLEPEDGGMFVCHSQSGKGEARLQVPKLNLGGFNAPTLTFLLYRYQNAAGKLSVKVTADDKAYTEVYSANTASFLPGWTVCKVNLAQYKDYPWIAIVFDGAVSNGSDYVIIDNIAVANESEFDAKLESIKGVRRPVVGESENYTVVVKNNGKQSITYDVNLYVDKTLVQTLSRTEALAQGETADHLFTVTPTAEMIGKETPIKAEVIAKESDEIPENNILEAIIIASQSELPVITDLVGEKTEKAHKLSWTKPTLTPEPMVDDFEGYESFIYENIGDYTVVDGDGLTSAGILFVEFPNMGTPMAFQVWEPLAEGVDVTSNNWKPHSGEKCLVSWAGLSYDGLTPQNDDYLISPEIIGGTNVSFYATIPTTEYTPETFEVLYSTTTTDVDAFELLATESVLNVGWKEYSYQLPENARYFAIHYISSNKFALLVDDLSYVPVSAVKDLSVVGYHVYCNGQKLTQTPIVETNYSTPSIEYGAYHVTVVYDKGESFRSNTVRLGTSAVDELNRNDIRVYGMNGCIMAEGVTGRKISVYGIDGRMLFYIESESDTEKIPMERGVYLVKVDNRTIRVQVR